MSDVTTGTAFNPQFFMNPPWWMGRVEDKEVWTDNIQGSTFTGVSDIKGWGHRYKVRVFNWHTGDTEDLQPEEIAMCQVLMPVTAGSGHGGASITPSIESGSVVFGFFMDGMAGQEGYILGVLGNSNNNCPKERGEPAPNQTKTNVEPGPDGKPQVTQSKPPTPPTGPGSAANQPLPPKVDDLSVDQLKKLLDPSKTPSREVFKAASEARQKAKAQGKSPKEIERLVLLATVKGSRKSGSDAGGNANCNKGYQQFNNTYSDGQEETSAKVPDNLRYSTGPLSTTEAFHVKVKSTDDLKRDGKVKIPLLDVSKENNSSTTGISKSISNLVNTVEDLKKTYNQVSAFATDSLEFVDEIQKEISGVTKEISGFTKNMIAGVRSYTYDRLAKEARTAASNLFPSEVPKFFQGVEGAMSGIACGFNKIVGQLGDIIGGLLKDMLDKVISTPLCAAEQFLSKILDNIMDKMTGLLDGIFGKLKSLLGGIMGLISGPMDAIGGLFGNIFDALDYVAGIAEFFTCDEPEEPVKYTEISLDGPAVPGGDAAATPTEDGGAPVGTGDPTASKANIVNNVTSTAPTPDPNDRSLEATLAREEAGLNAALEKERQAAKEDQNNIDNPTTDQFREAVKRGDSDVTGLEF